MPIAVHIQPIVARTAKKRSKVMQTPVIKIAVCVFFALRIVGAAGPLRNGAGRSGAMERHGVRAEPRKA